MTVYLVGAGPGDPGLLTRRGAQLLAHADVVVHDRLIDRRVLGLVPPGAILLDVGKQSGSVQVGQDEINALLVDYAKKASVIVRLKGGDPYVFGRGGEEAEALTAGCAYEVVPGVSSFAAVAATAGVPITLRGTASAFIVLTGHDIAAGAAIPSDLGEFARSSATLVIMMGVANRAVIAQRLIEAGRPPATSVLVVQDGTLPSQRSTRTTLDQLGAVAVESPATIFIGDVTRQNLFSYEGRPLASWRVVVTRALDQSDELVGLLEDAGAQVTTLPTIVIGDPSDDGEALRDALQRIGTFAWIVFGSKNAVERVFREIRDARSFGSVRVAAIGAATERALYDRGIVADLVPQEFIAESMVEAFPTFGFGADQSRRILLPRAAAGRNVIEEGLRSLGWEVEVVHAYRTLHPEFTSEAAEQLHDAHAVTFTSSSTVDGALSCFPASSIPKVIASIGPITSATIAGHGLQVAVEAEEHTVRGMLAGLIDYARSHPLPAGHRGAFRGSPGHQ